MAAVASLGVMALLRAEAIKRRENEEVAEVQVMERGLLFLSALLRLLFILNFFCGFLLYIILVLVDSLCIEKIFGGMTEILAFGNYKFDNCVKIVLLRYCIIYIKRNLFFPAVCYYGRSGGDAAHGDASQAAKWKTRPIPHQRRKG